jgi:GTPase
MSKAFRCGVVALVGRPNVGKSTLLNTLVGEKIAAVSPKAQTTRRRFRGIRSEQSCQIIFVDTPGLHRAPEGKKLNEFCVAEALDSLRDVDAIVYIVDGSRPLKASEEQGSDERFLIDSLKRTLAQRAVPLFVLLNKKDLWQKTKANFVGQEDLKAMLGELPVKQLFPVSAKGGDGIQMFIDELTAVLPEGPALYPTDELTDQSLRNVVAELIQEKLFYLLGDELPYSCAIEIESFHDPIEGDPKRRLPEIHAAIHVERESQKPMVIGKGGTKIKEIGQAARASIEELLGSRVVLKLFVKVTPKWSKKSDQLRLLGYVLPDRSH